MIHVIPKQDQQQVHLFGGNFHTNKPVVHGARPTLAPYSNLFYWSHAIATGDCEFGLHPHEGWEILTFVLAGVNTHYDTATQTWTPLQAGDFQVIQSGSGLQHAEKIKAGTQSFQIWFDPNFQQSLRQLPTYADYHTDQLRPITENGILTTYYVGGNSPASVQTEGLVIRTLAIQPRSHHTLPLDVDFHFAAYVLQGSVAAGDYLLTENDVLRVVDDNELTIKSLDGALLFVIENPKQPTYKTAWQ